MSAVASMSLSEGLDIDLEVTELNESGPVMSSKARIPSECTLLSSLGTSWVTVGQTSATASSVATQDFVYASSADTVMAAALLVGGVYQVSGTYAYSATSTIGFPAQKTAGTKHLRTAFEFGKLSCRYGSTQTAKTQIRAIALAGGNSLVSVSAPSATYCTSYAKDGYLEKKSTTAVTYSNGVAIKSKIGLDLSSRTGFTAEAKYKARFLKSGRLCGTKGYPADSPSQLVVKP